MILPIVLWEGKAFSNNKTIAKLYKEPYDLEALTAIHLLLMKGQTRVEWQPPGVFEQGNLYIK